MVIRKTAEEEATDTANHHDMHVYDIAYFIWSFLISFMLPPWIFAFQRALQSKMILQRAPMRSQIFVRVVALEFLMSFWFRFTNPIEMKLKEKSLVQRNSSMFGRIDFASTCRSPVMQMGGFCMQRYAFSKCINVFQSWLQIIIEFFWMIWNFEETNANVIFLLKIIF